MGYVLRFVIQKAFDGSQLRNEELATAKNTANRSAVVESGW